jgi:hypothetical protein
MKEITFKRAVQLNDIRTKVETLTTILARYDECPTQRMENGEAVTVNEPRFVSEIEIHTKRRRGNHNRRILRIELEKDVKVTNSGGDALTEEALKKIGGYVDYMVAGIRATIEEELAKVKMAFAELNDSMEKIEDN